MKGSGGPQRDPCLVRPVSGLLGRLVGDRVPDVGVGALGAQDTHGQKGLRDRIGLMSQTMQMHDHIGLGGTFRLREHRDQFGLGSDDLTASGGLPGQKVDEPRRAIGLFGLGLGSHGLHLLVGYVVALRSG